MTHATHVIYPPVPTAPRAADETDCLHAFDAAKPGDHVVVLGPQPAAAWAKSLGLMPTHLVTSPTPAHARRAIARLRRSHGGAWHVWGEAAATLTGMPPAEPTAESRSIEVPLPNLGLEEREIAIAPLTGKPNSIDSQRLMFLGGVLELMHRRAALVLPEGAARLDETRGFEKFASLASRVLIHRLPLSVAARVIDYAVFDADAPPPPRLRKAVEDAGAKVVEVERGELARPGLVDAGRALGPVEAAIAEASADAQ